VCACVRVRRVRVRVRCACACARAAACVCVYRKDRYFARLHHVRLCALIPFSVVVLHAMLSIQIIALPARYVRYPDVPCRYHVPPAHVFTLSLQLRFAYRLFYVIATSPPPTLIRVVQRLRHVVAAV